MRITLGFGAELPQDLFNRLNWTFVFYPTILFSPSGRRIAYTDLGPGPAGEEAVQIVILDLATGQRTMTSLPSGSTPPPAGPGASPYFLTCCPAFIDNETVLFHTFTDPAATSFRPSG